MNRRSFFQRAFGVVAGIAGFGFKNGKVPDIPKVPPMPPVKLPKPEIIKPEDYDKDFGSVTVWCITYDDKGKEVKHKINTINNLIFSTDAKTDETTNRSV